MTRMVNGFDPRVWRPIETAPRDGTYVDLMRDGLRWVDCHFDTRLNCWVREHDYPAVTTVFNPQPKFWMPRPPGLSDPYVGTFTGKHRDA